MRDPKSVPQAPPDEELQFRELFENNPLPMAVFDSGTLRHLAVNNAALAKYGYSREEFLSLTLLDVFVPADAQRLLDIQVRLAHQPFRHVGPFRHRTKNGAVIEVETASHAITFHGRAARMVVVYDVTERLRAERALRESEQRYRAVFEQAAVGIARVGVDGRFQEVNDKLAEIVGYGKDELIGLSFRTLTHPDDVEADRAQGARLVAGAASNYQLEKRYLRKTGEPVWINLSASLVRDEDGTPRYFVSIVEDIDQRKRAEALVARTTAALEAANERLVLSEAQLRHHRDNLSTLVEARTAELRHALRAAEAASRAKSEFVANMSHEFRTPLHAIRSFADLGTDRAADAPREKLGHYFRRIEESSERLLVLVNALLDIAKLEAGRLELDLGERDVAQLARAVIGNLDGVSQARGITVIETLRTANTMARVDGERIYQVIQNILSNALKFAPSNSAIEVEYADDALARGRPALRIAIGDRGPGIPEAELESIFQKFNQSSLTKSGAGGTGLGLAISRELVALHGGDIRAANRAGGGAVFSVRLPRG